MDSSEFLIALEYNNKNELSFGCSTIIKIRHEPTSTGDQTGVLVMSSSVHFTGESLVCDYGCGVTLPLL